MKRAFVLLTILGLAVSPLMVSQAEAAPVKHHATAKHHKKQLKKHVAKHAAKRAARKHRVAV